MFIIPQKTLEKHNIDIDLKRKRNLPIIERICLIISAGYVGYGMSHWELHVNDWYIWVISGFILAVVAGLLWRKQRSIDNATK